MKPKLFSWKSFKPLLTSSPAPASLPAAHATAQDKRWLLY